MTKDMTALEQQMLDALKEAFYWGDSAYAITSEPEPEWIAAARAIIEKVEGPFCDDCGTRQQPHWHCAECGATDHGASQCDNMG